MSFKQVSRRGFLGLLSAGAVCSPLFVRADGPARNLKEPLHYVSKAERNVAAPAANPNPNLNQQHPLDGALNLAKVGLDRSMRTINDYTATLIKRERVNGQLGEYQTIYAKIRNRKANAAGNIVVPFGVYLYFKKPTKLQGREVLYVEGKNNGKMMAHDAPSSLLYKTLGSVWLPPTGTIAMRGQLHPITDIGIENLIRKLIIRGTRERGIGMCAVNFRKNAVLNKRRCTVIEIRHDDRKPQYEFHLAHIFIDDELQVPIRYAAFDWPTRAGAEPEVIEEYNYIDLRINVGLTDADFDHRNQSYNFVKK